MSLPAVRLKIADQEKQQAETKEELAAVRVRLEQADADLVAARKLLARK